MNNFVSSNSVIRKYGLRRVPHYWNYVENGNIFYMLAPPWVRTRVNDVVNFQKIVNEKNEDDSDSMGASFSSEENDIRAKERIEQS